MVEKTMIYTYSSLRFLSVLQFFLLVLPLTMMSMHAQAQTASETFQAKRIYERLTGVKPTAEMLNTLLEEFTGVDGVDDGTQVGDGDNTTSGGIGIAYIAMQDDNFYRTTVKNWVAPWTNREHNTFVPLNDYIATVMGYIRDDIDFSGILSDDTFYTFDNLPNNGAAYSAFNNDHYIDAEATDPSYRFIDNLASQTQTLLNPNLPSGLLPNPAAGVMTTRAAAEAFFVDGTNRAMLRFTLVNHMCVDLEQLQDATLSPDRIRQDVSRRPGGDSRVFTNTCATCHSGMDPLAQAFAYYDFFNEDPNSPDFLQYTPEGAFESYGDFEVQINTSVNPKYHINDGTFPFGYRTPDDQWVNYWREGVNQFVGWAPSLDGSGKGAASLGRELANSDAFAQCQVKKVFQNVCLREPNSTDNTSGFAQMVSNFKTGYNLKQTFAEVANYCKGG